MSLEFARLWSDEAVGISTGDSRMRMGSSGCWVLIGGVAVRVALSGQAVRGGMYDLERRLACRWIGT